MRATKRARPIIMTTIAMTAGMMPIALGLGSDPSFRSPMSIAVIRGTDDLDSAESAGDSGSLYLCRRSGSMACQPACALGRKIEYDREPGTT